MLFVRRPEQVRRLLTGGFRCANSDMKSAKRLFGQSWPAEVPAFLCLSFPAQAVTVYFLRRIFGFDIPDCRTGPERGIK